MTQTSLPYAGTQGHSGTDTSRERAEDDVSSGRARLRQEHTLTLVGNKAYFGVTVSELRHLTGWHHGKASSVLSVLHKEGRLVRLTSRRLRCLVYVTPQFEGGRETSQQGRKKSPLTDDERRSVRVLAKAREMGYGYGPYSAHVDVLLDAAERLQ